MEIYRIFPDAGDGGGGANEFAGGNISRRINIFGQRLPSHRQVTLNN